VSTFVIWAAIGVVGLAVLLRDPRGKADNPLVGIALFGGAFAVLVLIVAGLGFCHGPG
jgi:hypothetical protein